MLRKAKRIARTLSFRLSLRVITVLATLLMVALLVMLFFSRKAVKEEALHAAEQTLEATVQSIDNILLDVEQAAGNVYWKMIRSVIGSRHSMISARCFHKSRKNRWNGCCFLAWATMVTDAFCKLLTLSPFLLDYSTLHRARQSRDK